jgi:hypothetical protein
MIRVPGDQFPSDLADPLHEVYGRGRTAADAMLGRRGPGQVREVR